MASLSVISRTCRRRFAGCGLRVSCIFSSFWFMHLWRVFEGESDSLKMYHLTSVGSIADTEFWVVWMYGPDWPTSGEIDIIEGANQATKNIISGHS